jgi:hypothetical protein
MALALAWGWGWDQCWQSLDGVPEPLVPNSRQSGQSASGVDLPMDWPRLLRSRSTWQRRAEAVSIEVGGLVGASGIPKAAMASRVGHLRRPRESLSLAK